eukprot:10877403-Heterocapsa_arctica.AAC.1
MVVDLWAFSPGCPALVRAAGMGNKRIVEHLLKARADVNALDMEGPKEAATHTRPQQLLAIIDAWGCKRVDFFGDVWISFGTRGWV